MQVRAEQLTKTLPLIIIGMVFVVVAVLVLLKPEAGKRNAGSVSRISIEVFDIRRSGFTPKVVSYGLVEPRIRSKLVAQVGGRVESVSERFRDGSFFRQGELLLQIDATDYEIEVDIAQASLAQAERVLTEEVAQAEQAIVDWKQVGDNGSANSLVLREPQVRAAKANVSSAKALLKQAKVNLARTSIRAPYDGRVLSTSVDLGQVASSNTVLGEVYATDAIEVRLPIKNNDLQLLKLPEDYSHQDSAPENLPTVIIRSELVKEEDWQGNIIRTAGSIDDSSRQLYVVARIDDPFGYKAEGRFPLKIGQYVTAEIDGIPLNSVISIPNKAIYQGSYVYLYRDGAVYRTPVEISWQNGEIAIVSAGITEGDKLVVSPLGQVTSGTLVNFSPGSENTNESRAVNEARENRNSLEEVKTRKGNKKGVE